MNVQSQTQLHMNSISKHQEEALRMGILTHQKP
jgi:hypothetical protein